MRKNWQTKKLGEICEYISRGISPKYLDKGGVFVLNQKCIRNHEVRYQEARNHDQINKGFSEDRLVKIGDVLINSTGVGTLGRVAQIKFLNGSTIVDSHITIVRPIKSLFSTNFFGWAMIYVEDLIKKMGVGSSGQTELSRSAIKEIIISYPESLHDQQRIVQQFDAADALTKKRKQAIGFLDDYLKGMFLEIFGDPVTNSKGWGKDKFGKIGTLDRGISKHRPRNAPELLGGTHPLIQTGDVSNAGIYIKDYRSTYSDIGLKQSKKRKSGTLCITIAANIAKTGILTFDACFPDSVVGFIPNDHKTNNEFMHFWMSFFQKILEANAPESAQKNINLRILRDLDVIVPPIELQNKFADIVHKVEKLRETMDLQSGHLERSFSALMQDVFDQS